MDEIQGLLARSTNTDCDALTKTRTRKRRPHIDGGQARFRRLAAAALKYEPCARGAYMPRTLRWLHFRRRDGSDDSCVD